MYIKMGQFCTVNALKIDGFRVGSTALLASSTYDTPTDMEKYSILRDYSPGALFTKLTYVFNISFGNFLLHNTHNFEIKNYSFTF
jgi:hypothetical protein